MMMMRRLNNEHDCMRGRGFWESNARCNHWSQNCQTLSSAVSTLMCPGIKAAWISFLRQKYRKCQPLLTCRDRFYSSAGRSCHSFTRSDSRCLATGSNVMQQLNIIVIIVNIINISSSSSSSSTSSSPHSSRWGSSSTAWPPGWTPARSTALTKKQPGGFARIGMARWRPTCALRTQVCPQEASVVSLHLLHNIQVWGLKILTASWF